MRANNAALSVPPKAEKAATGRTSSILSGKKSGGESSKSIQWNDTVDMETYDEQEFEDVEEQPETSGVFRKMLSRRTRRRQEKLAAALEEEEKAVVSAFEHRAFHIPSNKTWFEDWSQYVVNNHPLFGVCSMHPLNPIGLSQRFLAFVASVSVGCALTSIYFYWASLEETLNLPVFTLPFSTNRIGDPQTDSTEVTVGMLFLFTWIPCLHSLADLLSVYFIRNSIRAFLLWILVMVASSVVFGGLLAAEETAEEPYDPVLVTIYASIEIFLSWMVYYLLVASLLFSGVLGCFQLPVLGGRPHNLKWEANRKKKIAEKKVTTIESLADYSEYQS